MDENAATIDPTYPTGGIDPHFATINLFTLGEAGEPVDFDILESQAIFPDPDHDDEPDLRSIREFAAGLELYVPRGTESQQSGCVFDPDFRPGLAAVIDMLRRDFADEDWNLIGFRFIEWTNDPVDGLWGWSIAINDLNEKGVDRRVTAAYEAINEADDDDLADSIIDGVSDYLDDIDAVRDRFAMVLAREFHMGHLPDRALDIVYNTAVHVHAHAGGGYDESFARVMYDTFADFSEFLTLVNYPSLTGGACPCPAVATGRKPG